MSYRWIFHKCPTCSVEEDMPCRTIKGRKRETVHDTRKFSIVEAKEEKK